MVVNEKTKDLPARRLAAPHYASALGARGSHDFRSIGGIAVIARTGLYDHRHDAAQNGDARIGDSSGGRPLIYLFPQGRFGRGFAEHGRSSRGALV